MPIVLLKCKQFAGLEEISRILAERLPHIVSEALDTPENTNARLTPGDIEVEFRWATPRDVNYKDIEITVIAHDYPERTRNIEERKDKIIAGVREFLRDYDRNLTGWVWILPQQNSAFGTI